jgi:hypothetical protein
MNVLRQVFGIVVAMAREILTRPPTRASWRAIRQLSRVLLTLRSSASRKD